MRKLHIIFYFLKMAWIDNSCQLSLTSTAKFSVLAITPSFPSTKDGSLVIDGEYFDTCDRSKPILGIGSGDSSLLLSLTKNIDESSKTLFERVQDEVTWEEMFHKGNAVPRLICMQGTFVKNNAGETVGEPVYRHPADAQPPMCSWTPTVKLLRDLISDTIGQPLNHVLVQWYRCGDDYISEHADKTLDISRGSSIVNLSLGATRTMVLRDKKGHREDRKAIASRRHTQRVAMQDGCLFILGWNTNLAMTHEIRLDKRPVKSAEELSFGGHRISLTFRHVTTFLRWRDNMIFGQGAPIKTEAELDNPVNEALDKAEDSETVRLIEAFGAENRQSNFDWDLHYGAGFSVMNMQLSHSQPGRHELIRAASQLTPCTLQPSSFFLAWNGVLTLVYEGFPPSLTSIKQTLNNVTELKKEKFGSLWPKTTLAPTSDEAPPLTFAELKQLRSLCQRWSTNLNQPSTLVRVNEVSIVKFTERSLETATAITTVALSGTDRPDQTVSAQEETRVKEVLSEWEGGGIVEYLDKVNAPGSRASTYGSASASGSTVVAFLCKSQNSTGEELPRLVDAFRGEVEVMFPGRFSWMNNDSLHCTLRSLDM